MERQARRDREARARLAAEESARPAFRRLSARQEQIEAELNHPDRMSCCGAPKAGDDPTVKYSDRHYKNKISPSCDPARICAALRRKQSEGS